MLLESIAYCYDDWSFAPFFDFEVWRAQSSFPPYYDASEYKWLSHTQDRLKAIDDLTKEYTAFTATTGGEYREAIQQKIMLEWTFHSNAIEGSNFNMRDTVMFLQYGLTVGGRSLKDHLDALGHKEAFRTLLTGEILQ